MKYRVVEAAQLGGPEVLQVVEKELPELETNQVRIRVIASAVTGPDLTVRQGEALYSGTPLGKKAPLIPGYAVIGDVIAVGEDVDPDLLGSRVGVLTVVGGYTEMLQWRADRLIPVPESIDPVKGIPLLLNYLVAYQTLHRSAGVNAGETILIIGASGGIGTALLDLGKLAGLKMYGLASGKKHTALALFEAELFDYRTQEYLSILRESEPAGIDAVLAGVMTPDYIKAGLSLLRRGGMVVGFGEPENFSDLFRVLGRMVLTNLTPNGKQVKVYGTSTYFLFSQQPYLDDWAELFRLLEQGSIQPVIMERIPLLEAARANQLLESGDVIGNLVLAAPEYL